MTNQALVLSISETMVMLIRSMGRYTYYRLYTKPAREAFRLATKECLVHLTSGWENMDIIKTKIEGHRLEVDNLYPVRFLNKRHEERRAHILAVNQALDIVKALEARFITGQCDPEPRAKYNYGVYHENEDLFG